jgi:hypothetical protein
MSGVTDMNAGLLAASAAGLTVWSSRLTTGLFPDPNALDRSSVRSSDAGVMVRSKAEFALQSTLFVTQTCVLSQLWL